MGQYNAPDAASGSGIKVLDRAVLILTTIADQPRSLAELCQATKLPRATAHRLATALETHRMLSRTADGRWSIGSALTSLGSGSSDTLIDAATPIMNALMQRTGESVQLYRLTGTSRTCIASKEPPSGLQNTVPVGSRMPLTAGSSAHVFMAYAPPTLRDSILADAAFTPATRTLHIRPRRTTPPPPWCTLGDRAYRRREKSWGRAIKYCGYMELP